MKNVIILSVEETQTLKNAVDILTEYANTTNETINHIKARQAIENINDVLSVSACLRSNSEMVFA